MMAKSKKTRQQATTLENVEQALGKTEQYIEDNKKLLSIIMLVIVAAAGIYIGYKKLIQQPNEKKAQKAMYIAEEYFAQDSFRLALEGDLQSSGMLSIIDKYKGTKSANLANYYAGMSYLHIGDFENAIKYLKKYRGKDEFTGPMALGGIGDAYVEQGNLEEGVNYYLKASSKKDNDITTPKFLKKAGLVYEELGQYKKALEVYQKIEDEYPESPFAVDIKKYITAVKVKI
jgi:tetratricopeptide (TPR) repeat protein